MGGGVVVLPTRRQRPPGALVKSVLFCAGAAYALITAVWVERIAREVWRARAAVGLFFWTLGSGS
jgi:hypothetical protein